MPLFCPQGAATHLKPTDNVRKLLQSAVQSGNVLEMLKIMTPICASLEWMESKDATLSDAVAMWLQLCDKLASTSIGPLVRARSEQLLSHGFAIVAHTMDPRYYGSTPGMLLQKGIMHMQKIICGYRKSLFDIVIGFWRPPPQVGLEEGKPACICQPDVEQTVHARRLQ